MATDCIPQLTLKFQQKMKPVVACFDTEHASTDGGALLLKALDERLALTEDVAACLPDRRDPRKVQHALRDLVRQRVFGLACGYEDGHDAARLAHDPMHKLAVGRDPLSGAALASQPTLSRFENAMGPRALYRMGRTLAATVIAQHRHRLKGRARRITIDLDPTDDPTHGQQALAFFNGHYDTWSSLPLVATLTFKDAAEQDLVAVVLRPGNSPAKHGAFDSCGPCSVGCGGHLARRCGCAWMGDSPGTTGWTSWKRSGSSLSWGWPATRGWRSAPVACWARPTACRSTAAAPSMSTERRSMRPKAGRIAGA
jgi:hypothetical protein